MKKTGIFLISGNFQFQNRNYNNKYIDNFSYKQIFTFLPKKQNKHQCMITNDKKRKLTALNITIQICDVSCAFFLNKLFVKYWRIM